VKGGWREDPGAWKAGLKTLFQIAKLKRRAGEGMLMVDITKLFGNLP
jgi:hypothetical protein